MEALETSDTDWRVSTTLFVHMAGNEILEPIIKTTIDNQYSPVKASDYINSELSAINLTGT